MAQPRVYLDHNATAPLRLEAREAMLAALDSGNPSSVHREGRTARAGVEAARRQVADLVGASPGQVVFTSGATESNVQRLLGWKGPVAVCATEHDAVLAPRSDAIVLPVDASGRVDLDAIEALPEGTLACVMSAQSETGVLADLAAIGRVCAARGLAWHCDAVQSVGRGLPSPLAFGAASLTVSSHKLGGPKGAGALVLRDPAGASPLLTGGGQEKGLRAGTENVAALAGFGAAAAEATGDDWSAVAALRDWIEERMMTISGETVIVGAEVPRLPNTICAVSPGADAQALVIGLDLAGVAISAGSACSSGKVRRSRVVEAMGFAPDAAASAVRISLGLETTRAEAEQFLTAWDALTHTRIAA